MHKKGQTTIFIILAVLIVAGVVLFFIFRGSIGGQKVPQQFESVYANFLSCLEEDISTGIDLLGTQAGYIELPNFEPGSQHSPFSSQLNFLGNPIPYWYYVSRNNIPKSQVPSKSQMEAELEKFVEDRVSGCSFDSYYSQGFGVGLGVPDADVSISDGQVELNLDLDMNLEFSGDEVLVRNHEVVVNSKFGELYNSALEIYETEQENLFLEEYAVDILRLYAPVDGVELTCSPKIWNADEIFDDLQEAIEINTLSLENNADDYFDVGLQTRNKVRFINSRNWASNFEVNPSEGSFLISRPVGNQPGLGALGFCYVSHHYVYNMKYPVLVQVYDESSGEVFQFPLAVVLEGNSPRKPLPVSESVVEVEDIGLCENKNTESRVNVYDSNLNFVDANVSYECFGNTCQIGETSGGSLEEDFPQCVNGFVVVEAEGYKNAREIYSSVESGSVNIILEKIYEKSIDLSVDGLGLGSGDEAIINFVSDGYSTTIVYPSQETVKLVEGDYEISVYVYSEADLEIEESTYEQCVEVPRGFVGGIFGLTREECFDVDAPSQLISSSLSGGGTENYFIAEYELRDSGFININADGLGTPQSLEDVQENYLIFETKGLGVSFI